MEKFQKTCVAGISVLGLIACLTGGTSAQAATLPERPSTVRPAAITAGDFVMMTGGIPLMVDGQVVGAIGVSADTPQHDEQIAEAGVAALSP